MTLRVTARVLETMHRLVGEAYAPLYLSKLERECARRVPGDTFVIRVARGIVVRCVMNSEGEIDIDMELRRPVPPSS